MKAYSDTTPSRTGGGSDLDPCPLKRGRPTRQWLRPCAKPLTGGARWRLGVVLNLPPEAEEARQGRRQRRLPALPATISGDPATGVLGETCRIREATLRAPASSERSGPSPAAEDGIGHCRLRAQGRPGEEWRRWGLRGGGEGVLEWVGRRERGRGARIRAAVGGGTPAMERAGEH